MKRAAIIVTEADSISWDTYNDGHVYGVTTNADTSDQLLSDLQAAVRACELTADWIRHDLRRELTADETVALGMHQITEENADEWLETAARLRAAIDALT